MLMLLKDYFTGDLNLGGNALNASAKRRGGKKITPFYLIKTASFTDYDNLFSQF